MELTARSLVEDGGERRPTETLQANLGKLPHHETKGAREKLPPSSTGREFQEPSYPSGKTGIWSKSIKIEASAVLHQSSLNGLPMHPFWGDREKHQRTENSTKYFLGPCPYYLAINASWSSFIFWTERTESLILLDRKLELYNLNPFMSQVELFEYFFFEMIITPG